jgi:predicted nucleic acid-binding protein
VVYYELWRGLLKRNAQRLLLHLERLLAQLLWIDLTRSDWEAAATLWARTQLAGRPHADADILIAAQANNRRATVITDNARDFQDVADELESW